jgi:hypothetical protein
VEGGTALKRAYAKRHDSHKPDSAQPAVPIGATDREIQLSLDRVDLTQDGFGVKKSSVSRDFVRASAAQVKDQAERHFDGMHFPVILTDGVEYAGETMIVR